MLYNQLDADLDTLEGKKLKRVDDFKYLGSWIESSKKDLETRIGLAWNALNKIEKMWNSSLHRSLKLHFFRATVESVLLYGSESWTSAMRDRVDGTYTKMLRRVLGYTWRDHVINKELYGVLKSITSVFRERRLMFVGHIWRKRDEMANQLLLWEPRYGKRRPGRPALTYVDQLEKDTGLTKDELKLIMKDRKMWPRLVMSVRDNPN